jgi:hypothetical protein
VPYRVANYPEEVLFHGLVYLPFGVTVDQLEDASSMALIHLRAAFENVSRELIALCETYWAWDTPWTCTIWEIDVTQPNETAFADGSVYLVAQMQVTDETAVADLVAEGLTLSKTAPHRRYTTLNGFTVPRRAGF